MTARRSVATLVVAGIAIALAVACATDSSAQAASSGSNGLVAGDTAALGRLLDAARGAEPLYCELVTRHVDMHGSWSRYGSSGDDPLVTDSASAALIRWIQRTHNDPVFVPRLRAAMRDSDACVRRVASSFLARVDHPSAPSTLLDALGDSRAEVREVAAYGLGMAEFPGAVDALIGRLRDGTPGVRRASAWALGALESKKAQAPLMELLARDSDARVRQTAAWAIGNIK